MIQLPWNIPHKGHVLISRRSTHAASASGETKIVPPLRFAGKSGNRLRYRLSVLTLTPSEFATAFFPTTTLTQRNILLLVALA